MFAGRRLQLHISSDQCQKRAKAKVLDRLKVPTCESPLQAEFEIHVPGPKYSGSVINRDLNRETAKAVQTEVDETDILDILDIEEPCEDLRCYT